MPDWILSLNKVTLAKFVNKMTLKTKFKKNKIKKLKKILRNKSKTNIMDILSHFTHNQRPPFKTVFPKLKFLFFVLGSIFSRNMCKLHCKLRNAPLWSKFQIFMRTKFRLVLSFFLFFILGFQNPIDLVCFLKAN